MHIHCLLWNPVVCVCPTSRNDSGADAVDGSIANMMHKKVSQRQACGLLVEGDRSCKNDLVAVGEEGFGTRPESQQRIDPHQCYELQVSSRFVFDCFSGATRKLFLTL